MTEKDFKIEYETLRPTLGVGISAKMLDIPSKLDGSDDKVDKNGVAIIDSSWTVIPSNFFSHNNNVKTVIIPEGITAIDNYAFSDCMNLETVQFPKSLEHIGGWAFDGCIRLRNIDFGFDVHDTSTLVSLLPSMISLSPNIFERCHSLGILRWGDVLLHGDVVDGKGIIPEGVTQAGGFSKLFSLESIDLPEGMRIVGPYMFSECENLKHVTLPNTIEIIDWGAFNHCLNLQEISIPKSVHTISDEAFKNCRALTEIVIPASVETIGNAAVQLCTNLTRIKFEGTLFSAGIAVFANCPNLKQIIANKATMDVLELSIKGMCGVSKDCELIVTE